MDRAAGFIEFARKPPPKRAVSDRLQDFREFGEPWSETDARQQGARCMNCSVPFCHGGCPLGNVIPDFNDHVYKGQWKQALAVLHSTNNFPEFTGRICPAPCEASCILSINQDPVTIEYIEKAIADRGWEEGWIVPEPPKRLTGKSVAVVGSGPAGLAAAQQLRRCGHDVTVFERADYIGGLLRVGIPDFKLDKHVVQRRIDQMEQEGVVFKTGVAIGDDYAAEELADDNDAVLLAGGSTQARDLHVEGRDLKGVHFAMEYLTQQNRLLAGEYVDPAERITAEGKRVVILGGGRYRRRLSGHRPPTGRGGRLPVRASAGAARRPAARQPVAPVAAGPAHVGGPRGGRHPRLQRPHRELFRRRRGGQQAPRSPRRVG